MQLRQFIGGDYEAAPVPVQAHAALADFERRLLRYEAFDRRAHRYKSSAARINLFGAALTTLWQATAAEQNGRYTGDHCRFRRSARVMITRVFGDLAANGVHDQITFCDRRWSALSAQVTAVLYRPGQGRLAACCRT
jgi:hypothetical protein